MYTYTVTAVHSTLYRLHGRRSSSILRMDHYILRTMDGRVIDTCVHSEYYVSVAVHARDTCIRLLTVYIVKAATRRSRHATRRQAVPSVAVGLVTASVG